MVIIKIQKIEFYNTHGIKIYKDMISLEKELNDMQELDMSYLELSKINIAVDKSQVMAELHEGIKHCIGKEVTIQTATKTKNEIQLQTRGNSSNM